MFLLLTFVAFGAGLIWTGVSLAGDWRMLSSTYPAKKTEAWAAQFDVPVAAGAESVLQYRVRVRW